MGGCVHQNEMKLHPSSVYAALRAVRPMSQPAPVCESPRPAVGRNSLTGQPRPAAAARPQHRGTGTAEVQQRHSTSSVRAFGEWQPAGSTAAPSGLADPPSPTRDPSGTGSKLWCPCLLRCRPNYTRPFISRCRPRQSAGSGVTAQIRVRHNTCDVPDVHL